MKLRLSNGIYVQIDEEDVWVTKWKWHLHTQGYAVRRTCINGKQKLFRLHRIIWENYSEIPKDMVIDHINLDKLDCRKNNLRLVTRHQNNLNKAGYKNTSSSYKGVCLHRGTGKWYMQIKCGEKIIRKLCSTEEEAALLYNQYAKELHGEYAFQNSIRTESCSQAAGTEKESSS